MTNHNNTKKPANQCTQAWLYRQAMGPGYQFSTLSDAIITGRRPRTTSSQQRHRFCRSGD